MPDKNSTAGYEHAAKATVDLIEYKQMPNELSDVILETLIEMSGESKVNIWHAETGISALSLAALYSMYETGAGHRRMRLYGAYEAGRTSRTRRRK